jgi:hypothetical protein
MPDKKRLSVLAFVPGTLFWVLIVAGVMTKNDAMIGAGVVIAVVTVVTLVTLKVRSSSRERAERLRLWNEGTPGTAKVVTIGTDGGSFNDHPYVDLELDVTIDGKPPYRATTRALISQLAIPRIQPDCQIAVKIDPKDPQHILVDATLTPYGYK